MSISLQTQRGALYTYGAAGVNGRAAATYTKASSPDSDGLWWVSTGAPSGREPIVATKPEAMITKIVGCRKYIPVTNKSLWVIDGMQYLVHVVLPRDHGSDEVQCFCENVTGQDFALTPA